MEEEVTFPAKVFVYGTLKSGHGNNPVLGDSVMLRRTTAYGILLHLGGFPGFLPETSAMGVQGELWEVKTKGVLNALDGLEGHPRFYTRKKIHIAGGEEVWTYVYTSYYHVVKSGVQHDFDIIPSGVWTGRDTAKVPFLGFYTEKPPKTNNLCVAHLHLKGTFSGLLDCATGQILRSAWNSIGKPHLVHNSTTGVWEPVKITNTPVNVQKIERWEPYVDPLDPGEVTAEERTVQVA